MVMAVAAAYLWRDRGEPETAVAASAPDKPLKVYFGGCHEVHEGPVCMLSGTATITLWMEDPGYEPVVLVDGEARVADHTSVDNGKRVRVVIDHRAKSLSLLSDGREQVWHLDLDEIAHSSHVKRAIALRSVDPAKGLEVIDVGLRVASDHESAQLWSIRARLQSDQGNREWRNSVMESIRRHRASGCLTGVSDDLAFMSYRLRMQGELSAASEAVASLRELSKTSPESNIALEYFGAMLDQQEGDYRSAANRLRRLDKWSLRLSNSTYRGASIQMRLVLLLFVSRHDDARDLLSELENLIGRTSSPCERARMLNNFSWFSQTIDLESSLRAIEQARILFREECPDELHHEYLMHLTRGYVYLRLERFERVQEIVRELRTPRWADALQVSRVSLDELESQLDMKQGRFRSAIALLKTVRDRTSPRADPKRYWKSLSLLAEAYLALGDTAGAKTHLRAAEDALDRLVVSIPLGEGRIVFAEEHLESSEALIRLLLKEGDSAPAYAVALRSTRRYLSSISLSSEVGGLRPDVAKKWERTVRAFREARQSMSEETADVWKMTRSGRKAAEQRRKQIEEELARGMESLVSLLAVDWSRTAEQLLPGQGEVLLHPSTRGIYVFMRDSDGLSAFEATMIEGKEPIKSLLSSEAFVDWISTKSEIRVLAYGALVDVPIERVLQSRNLGPTFVGVSMGLPQMPARKVVRKALVLCDPDGSLPHSRAEAESVKKKLEERQWEVELLCGDEVTRARLAIEIESRRYGLVHFAGHAALHGFDGWRSYLHLAGRDRLEVSDVFALESVPPQVVLSSCYGGGSEGAPLGMAQAFLVKGAQLVVAASDFVDDEAARLSMEKLYANQADGRLESGLANVQWSDRASDFQRDVGFRAYVR